MYLKNEKAKDHYHYITPIKIGLDEWRNGHFRNWFHYEFIPSVEKHLADYNLSRKIVLILDNAPSHPLTGDLEFGGIKGIFQPANVTSVLTNRDPKSFKIQGSVMVTNQTHNGS